MRRGAELALLVSFAGIVVWQAFVPPVIGIANNGDFSKVCMQFCLGPRDGWGTNWHYFVTDYVPARKYCWKSDMRVTEAGVAAVTIGASRLAGSGDHFDIRWQGAAHAAVLFAAFAIFVAFLRRFGIRTQLVVGALAIWIFTDVRYVAYLNSFYMDASALVMMLLTLAAAGFAIRTGSPRWLIVYALAAAAFAMSKGAHGPYSFVAAALPLAMLRRARAWAAVGAGIIIAASIASVTLTPAGYKGQALYNVVFFRILGQSHNRTADAAELGVPPEYIRYAGSYAYLPDSPGRKLVWVEAFYRQTGFGRVLKYYLKHPLFVVSDLAADLQAATAPMRSPGLANFRSEDGRGPDALSHSFSSWTALRTAAFRAWPGHVVLWYALFAGAAAAVWWKYPEWRGYALLAIGLAAAGLAEFGVSCLADAVETDRHLFIFHAMTDATVVFAAVAVATIVEHLRAFAQVPELTASGKTAY